MKILFIVLCVSSLVMAETVTSTSSTAPASSLGLESLPVKINALLQAWAVSDITSAAKTSSNFRLRRAELKLSGNIIKSTRYFVMADLAKAISNSATGDNRVLQDLGIGFTILPGLEIIAGQFKTQTSAEGLLSSADLLLPERSRVGRFYGDKREPGAMVSFEKDAVKISAMVSNGNGANQDSIKSTKDLSLRTDVAVMKQWKVGAFGQFVDFQYASRGSWGVNTRYSTETFVASAEYMMGKIQNAVNQGFMVDAGYFLTKEIQPVIRYEIFRNNVESSVYSDSSTLGINYVLGKNNAKIQAAYSYMNNMNGGVNGNGSADFANGSTGGLFNLAFQMAI